VARDRGEPSRVIARKAGDPIRTATSLRNAHTGR
jgi:hypothetical protein